MRDLCCTVHAKWNGCHLLGWCSIKVNGRGRLPVYCGWPWPASSTPSIRSAGSSASLSPSLPIEPSSASPESSPSIKALSSSVAAPSSARKVKIPVLPSIQNVKGAAGACMGGADPAADAWTAGAIFKRRWSFPNAFWCYFLLIWLSQEPT
ncbi:hypothetical protein BC828DRAFT_375727 [Blastocladiella britannica]|nr:hypothetical protein BC828DRAFT_375727 [Blastocladiella britannica]